MFKKGDRVEILPEFQDDGDDQFCWIVLDDEEKGRVDICPTNLDLPIRPRYTVRTNQIQLSPNPVGGLDALVNSHTLALEFSRALRSLLSSEEMQAVVLLNASEADSRICHSHDFCDANVVMHDIFLAHGMDPAEQGGAERWGPLWDDAWSLAKAAGVGFSSEGYSRET
ncbi:MAG: hypothetical protein HYZ45_10005 [Burkholderiales bacterium]|nr:hypothetical protein [Burkholderiales bacterium]